MNHETPRVLLQGLAFGEGPRWHDGRLWFADQHACRVMTVDIEGHAETVIEVPQQPSGLGWLPDGRMLVVSMKDRRLLRLDNGALQEVADLGDMASFHCNDMVVDSQGRAYIGNFGFDLDNRAAFRKAELILVEPDGRARVVARDLAFPNGMVISDDGQHLIVAETFANRLSAFDIAADGSLSNRRQWAKLETSPDGICLDAEAAIWMACPLACQVLRVGQDGEVLQRIATSQPSYACMLGGHDGRSLFIMTAPSAHPNETLAQRRGKVELVQVDVPRAGRP